MIFGEVRLFLVCDYWSESLICMSAPIRICLIDDEKACRDALRIFLAEGCSEALIIGEAASLEEASVLLQEQSPDLVLLDIALEDGTGFDLLDCFPHPGFRIIFTTAFDEFALRAFRYSALDYLLKPVDQTELITAVRKVNAQRRNTEYSSQLDHLRHNTSTGLFDRITLNTGDGMLFVQIDEIMRFEALGNYSFVFLENGERHMTVQSLGGFEEMLPNPPFFRAHQSHLVNTKFVRKLAKGEGDSLQLTDKSIVPLARRRKYAFVEAMKRH